MIWEVTIRHPSLLQENGEAFEIKGWSAVSSEHALANAREKALNLSQGYAELANEDGVE